VTKTDLAKLDKEIGRTTPGSKHYYLLLDKWYRAEVSRIERTYRKLDWNDSHGVRKVLVLG
jgi:hypothetical protein